MLKNFVVRLMELPYLLDEPGDGGTGGGDGKPDGGTPDADNGGDHKSGDSGDKGKPTGGDKSKPPVDDSKVRGLLAEVAKERKARQAAETARDERNAELEQERRRVQALAGVNPRSKEEVDEEAIRQRMQALYPHLGEMTSEDLKALREMKGVREQMEAATKSQWTNHATKMLSAVTDGVAKALGGKLSERQALRVERAYVAEAKANPEFLARHEAGDPSLADEFVKEWLDDFVEPGRRSALAEETARTRRVPDGKGRTINVAGEKKIDVNDAKAVEDVLVAGFKARGGQFGRR